MTDGGMIWACFHILVSVSLLAALIADITDLNDDRVERLRRLNIVQAKFDTDMMLSLVG